MLCSCLALLLKKKKKVKNQILNEYGNILHFSIVDTKMRMYAENSIRVNEFSFFSMWVFLKIAMSNGYYETYIAFILV